jgi:Lhr-like helicase
MKKFSVAPWPIILTTSSDCLGHDLTSVAYVIQTEIPPAWAIFVQNAGRANRVDPTADLTGALITTEAVADIDSVKKGCEYEQQR